MRCDVSSSAEVNAMFDRIDAHFGTLHILINNAALVLDKPHDDERRKRHYALVTQPLPRQSLEITRNECYPVGSIINARGGTYI
jgi:3-oxoacyl-[acyl-carrier protein] reductase